MKFFDHHAPRWDEMSRHDRSRLARIAAALELFPGVRILDVGCGTGVFTEFLLEEFREPLEIVCADFSGKMLEVAQEKLSGRKEVSFCCLDVTTESFPGKAFDRIICYSCFPHLNDKKAALSNFRNHLTPGGLLVIAHSESYMKINEFHRKCEGPVRHDTLPGPAEMKKMLEESEFSPVTITDEPDIYIVKAGKGGAG
ncbi:MAG: class I SAM-dependent methyltransferase [Candidatus Xenobiia bacterium LiM19]